MLAIFHLQGMENALAEPRVAQRIFRSRPGASVWRHEDNRQAEFEFFLQLGNAEAKKRS
jgi:hypothetical protein